MNRLQHFILDPVSKRPLMFLLLTLLFSVPGWLYCWNIYGEYYPLSRLVGWLLFITAMPTLMAWACCFIRWRIVRGLIYMATVSLFAINIFLTLNFDTMISPWILLLIHETNSNESSEFLSTYALSTPSIVTYGLTLLSVGLIVIGEKMGRSITIKRPRLMLFPFILWLAVGVWQTVLVIMMFFASTQSQLQAWYEGKAFYCIENTPANLLYSCYHLHLTNHENDAAWEASEKVFQSVVTRDEKDTLDVVLIIGESYNKYHASIYGYYLDTTPTMREQQKRGNLFVFQDAISPYNMTTLAVKNMLSTNSISLHQSWEEHPLVMTIFRKAGFDVAMWDNQKSENNVLFHDFSNNSLLYGKKMVESTYHHLNNAPFDYDQQLVDTALTVKRKPGSTLTVFHLMGQHTAPIWRYPENDENAIYTADSIQPPAEPQIQTLDNGFRLSWSRAPSQVPVGGILYNVYSSPTYPVDVNDPATLRTTLQDSTHLLIRLMTDKRWLPYYAVTAVNRWGQESKPLPLNSPESQIVSFTTDSLIFPLYNGDIRLRSVDGAFVEVCDETGRAVWTRHAASTLPTASLQPGLYTVKEITRKGRTHILGRYYKKH